MTAGNVQKAVEELFTSVSEGKSLIASAITDKGVETEADAAFQTMRDNILALPSGGVELPEDVYSITLTADPPNGGTVSGGGYASAGMTCNALAIPDTENDYFFKEWIENEKVVKDEQEYSFIVDSNRSLIAKFLIPQYIAGQDWFPATLPSSARWDSVTYGNGKFVAVASNSNKAAYSFTSNEPAT